MSLTKISAIALLMGCAFFADAKADVTDFASCMIKAAKDFGSCTCKCGCKEGAKETDCDVTCSSNFATATTDCVAKYPPAPTKK